MTRHSTVPVTPAKAISILGQGIASLVILVLAACGGGNSGGGSGGIAAHLDSIVVTPADSSVQVGTTLNLVATGNYSDGTTRDLTASASWTSSATQVATVGASGTITAIADGTTTITADYNLLPGSAAITVHEQLVFIHTFQSGPTDAGGPGGPLLQASDGNFYGTSNAGGANYPCRPPDNLPCGTVFKMTPSGDVTVLYSFGASATDGFWPEGHLIQGADGALYGTTSSGGTHGAGTVFKITLDGVYTLMYSFGASPADGIVPVTGLIQASDGNFYGTTASGGANHCVNIPQDGSNCGTAFRISPTGVETVLYSFGASPSDGVEPEGSLIQASDGDLYGTTADGGANSCSDTLPPELNNCGTVFKITLAGVETVLHSFGTSLADGIAPLGPLIQGNDGALYGTTASGGGGYCGWPFSCGTVFRITPAGSVTIIYAFATTTMWSDGYGPSPFLIQASDGNFYGTTVSGGAVPADLNGTVFRLTPSGVKTILYSFGPFTTNPSDPGSGVIQAGDGAYYGIASYSGQGGGSGTAFRLVAH
jgi:uncharacterized repeat protein (TIGR03803 family)